MAFTKTILLPRVLNPNPSVSVSPAGVLEQNGQVTYQHVDVTEYEQGASILTAGELLLSTVFGGLISSAESNDNYFQLITASPFKTAKIVAYRQATNNEVASGQDIGIVSIVAWGEFARSTDNI